MAYLTVYDLRQALAPDADPDDPGSAASMSDPDLTERISEAQAEVDAALGERYTTPFPDGTVPPLVKSVTTAIAAYLATLTSRAEPLSQYDPVLLAYQRAESLLQRLVNGTLMLGPSQPDVSGDPTVVNPLDFDLFHPHEFIGHRSPAASILFPTGGGV